MRRIPIYFTFDDGYVNPAAVAFFTLLDRAGIDVYYEMHILHHGISPAHQEFLRDIVTRSGKGELAFHDTGDFLIDIWQKGNWDGHQHATRFTADAVMKCFGAKFLPQYDKIIYSDVDVLFKADVSELWDVDVSRAYIAGVRNVFLKHLPMMLSHFDERYLPLVSESYLDGGLWVMNLKKIREDRLEDRMLAIAQDPTIVKRWPDQDIMNIACAGQIVYLPLNYISRPHLPEALRTPGFTSHYSRDEIFDAILRPKILHYAGRKPWNEDVRRGDEWWDVADYLALDLQRPEKDRRPDSVMDSNLRREKRARRAWRLLFFVAVACLLILVGLFLCVTRLEFQL